MDASSAKFEDRVTTNTASLWLISPAPKRPVGSECVEQTSANTHGETGCTEAMVVLQRRMIAASALAAVSQASFVRDTDLREGSGLRPLRAAADFHANRSGRPLYVRRCHLLRRARTTAKRRLATTGAFQTER